MTSAYDYLDEDKEKEERTRFRRFIEDTIPYNFAAKDFNLSNGYFSNATLEMYFTGWAMCMSGSENMKLNGDVLGYVKIKKDSGGQIARDPQGNPICTSYSALPQEDHIPVKSCL